MKRLLMVITLVSVLSATALAGEMPGVNPNPKATTGDDPTVGSIYNPGETQTPPSVDGDSGGYATTDETGSSLVMTVFLTIITFIGR